MMPFGLRAGDFALAAWNAAGVPLVVGTALAPILTLGDAPDPIAGAVQLAAVVAAVLAIATRPADDGVVPVEPPLDGRLAFLGPLVAAVMLVAGSASAYLGLGIDGVVVGIAFIVITASLVFVDRLPVVDRSLRRAMIVPFIAIAAGIFNGLAADMLEGMDVGGLIAAATVDDTGFAIFVIGMVLAGLAFFYTSLIVAPRILADIDGEHGWILWPARFVLYLVSAVLGIGWLTVLGG
jgi:hypothetical protein